MTFAIEVEKVSKTYKQRVLSDLSFQINAGEAVALVGANGAGKSTLLKILLGLVHADSGEARIWGSGCQNQSGREFLGYVPEFPSFWPELSAKELLIFAGRFRDVRQDQVDEDIEKLLKSLGLWNRAGGAMGKYSKGMLQRTAIAQALLHRPRLLILDEPMSGLDPRAQTKLRQVLLDFKKQGTTLFISSHSLEDIQAICDRVLVLEKSQLVENGPTQDVLKRLVEKYQSSEPWDEDPMEGNFQ